MDYLAHLLVLLLIYGSLAVSLDLLIGHLGLFSIAHAAFSGLGAYSTVRLIGEGLPAGLAVLTAAALACVASLLISLPSKRLRGDYYAIGTFALQMVSYSLFLNLVSITGGPLGLATNPAPFQTLSVSLVSAAAVFLVAILFSAAATSGSYGRVLHAIRDDETVAQSLGKDVVRFKVTMAAVSAAIAASAGAVLALHISYIHPDGFTVMEAILLISMVVIGGAGTLWGPVLGACALVLTPELLRFIGLPNSLAADARQMLYAGLLLLILVYRPQGILGSGNLVRKR